MRKAVIDVGSNSVLLVVEENVAGIWSVVCEATQVTALGEGVKQTGVLGEKGMDSTLDALRRFWELAGDTASLAFGTMAVRMARNTPEFQARASAQGTPIHILSGDMEAQLGFESVAYDPKFAIYDRISIIDPGGQSTELTTAVRHEKAWKMEFRKSFSIGTLALRGRTLAEESPPPGALLAATKEIDDAIGVDYLRDQAGRAVVLGAAGTNLVSIREKLTEWQPEKIHGQVLTFEEVSKSVSWLGGMTDAQRAAVPGMEAGRERTIHIGALVLERVMNAIGVNEVAVSVRGWRHALLERGLPNS